MLRYTSSTAPEARSSALRASKSMPLTPLSVITSRLGAESCRTV